MSTLSGEFILGGTPPRAFPVAQDGLDGKMLAERRKFFETAVRENLGWLRGWFRGHLQRSEAVDDLCQESFLKALEHLSELRDPDRFSSWLHRIALNMLRDHLRSEARQRGRMVATESLDGIEAACSGADPATVEEAERLLEAIRALPEKLREPLILRHSRDLSYREIGAILGIRENAVQVRIFRARRMLREQLGPSEARNGQRTPQGEMTRNGPDVEAPAIDRGPRP